MTKKKMLQPTKKKKRQPPRSRQSKYPDTDTFHFHNANPKGKYTTDCVERAICTALDLPYEQVVRDLAELQIALGVSATDAGCYDKYLARHGYVQCRQPKHEDRTKYTGNQFCTLIAEPDKTYVANLGSHHVVAIVNAKVYDTWNSTYGVIGNYWCRKD